MIKKLEWLPEPQAMPPGPSCLPSLSPLSSGPSSRAILNPLPQPLVPSPRSRAILSPLPQPLGPRPQSGSSSCFSPRPPTPAPDPQCPNTNSPTELPLFSKFFPLPFPLNLPEPVPLKLSCLRIQRINALFYILPGLKLNCEPQSKIFSQVTGEPHRFVEEFNTVLQTQQLVFFD